MNNFIGANTDEIRYFLKKLDEIHRSMDVNKERINNNFHLINNWDDEIRNRLKDVLGDIDKKAQAIFEDIKTMIKNTDIFVDMLDEYLDLSKKI